RGAGRAGRSRRSAGARRRAAGAGRAARSAGARSRRARAGVALRAADRARLTRAGHLAIGRQGRVLRLVAAVADVLVLGGVLARRGRRVVAARVVRPDEAGALHAPRAHLAVRAAAGGGRLVVVRRALALLRLALRAGLVARARLVGGRRARRGRRGARRARARGAALHRRAAVHRAAGAGARGAGRARVGRGRRGAVVFRRRAGRRALGGRGAGFVGARGVLVLVHVAEREGGSARQHDDGRKENGRELAHMGPPGDWLVNACRKARCKAHAMRPAPARRVNACGREVIT